MNCALLEGPLRVETPQRAFVTSSKFPIDVEMAIRNTPNGAATRCHGRNVWTTQPNASRKAALTNSAIRHTSTSRILLLRSAWAKVGIMWKSHSSLCHVICGMAHLGIANVRQLNLCHFQTPQQQRLQFPQLLRAQTVQVDLFLLVWLLAPWSQVMRMTFAFLYANRIAQQPPPPLQLQPQPQVQFQVAAQVAPCPRASVDAQPILPSSLHVWHIARRSAHQLQPLRQQECVAGKIVKPCPHACPQMHAVTMRSVATVAVAFGVQDQLCFWCRHVRLEEVELIHRPFTYVFSFMSVQVHSLRLPGIGVLSKHIGC